jgi:uncharacterized protein YndB with AHSA1/START domain
MLKLLGYLVLLAVLMVGGVLAYASTRPDDFAVTRSAIVAAPPETIFPLIADFRQWPAWSPWEKRDPAMKRELSGAESGVGAVYAWSGNSDVGSGRMEITGADAPSKVTIQLDFTTPIETRNLTEFTLVPTADGTEVTWTMSGRQPLLAKVFDLLMDMDAMVGADFESGLANLKAASEK